MVPLCETPRALCEWLARGRRVDAGELAAKRRLVDERPLAYPLGAEDAALVAIVAGLSRLHVRTIAATAVADELKRIEHLGLVSHVAVIRGATRLFLGREPWRLREAARVEEAEEHVVGGEMYEVPQCCIDAFMAAPRPRTEAAVQHANHARPRGYGYGLVNCCDRRVFHYVPWIPCGPACWASQRHAADVQGKLAAYGPFVAGLAEYAGFDAFVGEVSRALSAHRLFVLPGVQLSLQGDLKKDAVYVRHAWATATDRHPGYALDADEGEAAARLLLRLAGVSRVWVDRQAVWFDGEVVVRAPHAFLAGYTA